MKKQFAFIGGVVLGASLAIGSVAYADNIDVSLNAFKIFVNGVDKTPVNNQYNNNGSVVPAELIYNGTTYVPLHLASNLLGTPISYDGANRAIHLGVDPANEVYLSDFQPYQLNGDTATLLNNDHNTLKGETPSFGDSFQMTMGGTNYAKGISIYGWGSGGKHDAYFNLNGNYKTLSCLVGLDDQTQATTEKGVTIFADGKQVWNNNFNTGDLPKQINLDLTGVLQLDIQVSDTGDFWYHSGFVDIVNPVLK